MLFYLTGDSALKKEIYIREFLKKETDCEYRKVFSDEKDKTQELSNASMSIGLFSTKKVYDLIDFDEWTKAEKEEFTKIDFSNESVVVFVRTEKVGKDIKESQYVSILTFEKPKEWEEDKWIDFIMENSKFMGVNLTHEAAAELFRLIGTDELALLSEIEKLSVYSSSTPSLDDIDSVVYKRTVSKIDEFTFALSEKQLSKARKLVNEICDEYEPVVIVYSLSKHFIDLLQVLAFAPRKPYYTWPDIADISKKTGLPTPKVARFVGFKFKDSKYTPVNHIEQYSVSKLRRILETLYFIDREIKLGGDLRILLLDFINKIENLNNPIQILDTQEEGEN